MLKQEIIKDNKEQVGNGILIIISYFLFMYINDVKIAHYVSNIQFSYFFYAIYSSLALLVIQVMFRLHIALLRKATTLLLNTINGYICIFFSYTIYGYLNSIDVQKNINFFIILGILLFFYFTYILMRNIIIYIVPQISKNNFKNSKQPNASRKK